MVMKFFVNTLPWQNGWQPQIYADFLKCEVLLEAQEAPVLIALHHSLAH